MCITVFACRFMTKRYNERETQLMIACSGNAKNQRGLEMYLASERQRNRLVMEDASAVWKERRWTDFWAAVWALG